MLFILFDIEVVFLIPGRSSIASSSPINIAILAPISFFLFVSGAGFVSTK
jgi:NADH:ubiquinone oxidoreductase subunit 3 (subunit A)